MLSSEFDVAFCHIYGPMHFACSVTGVFLGAVYVGSILCIDYLGPQYPHRFKSTPFSLHG